MGPPRMFCYMVTLLYSTVPILLFFLVEFQMNRLVPISAVYYRRMSQNSLQLVFFVFLLQHYFCYCKRVLISFFSLVLIRQSKICKESSKCRKRIVHMIMCLPYGAYVLLTIDIKIHILGSESYKKENKTGMVPG